MTVEEVRSDVQKTIDSDDTFKGLFEAFADGLHEEQGTWFVPIKLTKAQPATRRMEIYSKFAALEDFLQSKKNLKVLLLPVLSKHIA